MSDYRVANRYAKSLFLIAREENCVDAVYDDLMAVIRVAEASRDLSSMLSSPVIPSAKKVDVLERTFQNAHKRTMSFFRLLAEKRREAQLVPICREFMRKVEEEKGIARAKVTSAIPLGEEVLDQIRRYLKGAIQTDEVVLENIVDDKTIGGMVIEYEDKLLDLSVARELKEIRKTLIYN